MNRPGHARALCNELRRLWLEADENQREQIAAEISGLTDRGAWLSLSERATQDLAESASEGGAA